MREKFTVAADAPPHVHDLARQVEDAFARAAEQDALRDALRTIADLNERLRALEAK